MVTTTAAIAATRRYQPSVVTRHDWVALLDKPISKQQLHCHISYLSKRKSLFWAGSDCAYKRHGYSMYSFDLPSNSFYISSLLALFSHTGTSNQSCFGAFGIITWFHDLTVVQRHRSGRRPARRHRSHTRAKYSCAWPETATQRHGMCLCAGIFLHSMPQHSHLRTVRA